MTTTPQKSSLGCLPNSVKVSPIFIHPSSGLKFIGTHDDKGKTSFYELSGLATEDDESPITDEMVQTAENAIRTLDFQNGATNSQESLDKPLTREDLANEQEETAANEHDAIEKLLKHYMPPYMFNLDPNVKNPDDHTPTLLEKQVTRAIANAELNVYLSHFRSLNKKLEFLTKYKTIKDDFTGKKSTLADKMRQIAQQHPLKDSVTNETIFHEPKPSEEGKKVGKTGPKSAAFEFAPLLHKKLRLTNGHGNGDQMMASQSTDAGRESSNGDASTTVEEAS